jgi:phage baseplate assembly protein W
VNLSTPFRRDARDFARATGVELLLSQAEQVLGTEADSPRGSGELPWRTSFGSLLHLLRHRPNDAGLAELARVHARDALARWVPRVRIAGCAVDQAEGVFVLRIGIEAVPPASNAKPQGRDVVIPLASAGAR